MAVTDGNGDQQYEDHATAIAADLDIELFAQFVGALTANDELLIQRNADGSEVRVTVQQLLNLVAGVDTIYTADGSFAGNRVVSGGGTSDLVFNNIDQVWFDVQEFLISNVIDAPAEDDLLVIEAGGTIRKRNVATLPAGGGGVGYSQYLLNVAGQNIQAFSVAATGAGITVVRDSANELTVTIPTGVDIFGGAIHLLPANNFGTDAYVRFNFVGNGADSNARTVNTTKDNIRPPWFWIANKFLAAGSLSRANPIIYNEWTGTNYPKQEVTGVAPLEIHVTNYNEAPGAGSQDSVLMFNF